MKEWIKKSIDKIKKDWIPVTALIISIAGAVYQFNQSNRYSNNTNKILMNSAKLAEYDIDVMIYKIDNGGDDNLDYGQFRFQLDSLQQNFKTIESIDPTSLNTKQSMNYQVYRQNLNAIIYKMTSYVNSLRVNQSDTPKDTDKLHIDIGARQNFYYGSGDSLKVLVSDFKALKDKKSLYDNDYKNALKKLEEQK
ncbi:hypothetical protein KIJ00_04010 [Leuconostoc gelidum subsp. aenigmaticum]|uniref:hypothetical protein n=1 Tax=Leuconostoc gelidum TaxID=1244 RepID=UPI001CC7512F|nr:hypothetical protein [Leuconostoc gelidum]MBZ6008420.1 hypothetical protein [Leuconostoc gelidum subsp. aenigmaticum]